MLIKNLKELNEGYNLPDSAFINTALGAYSKAVEAADSYKSTLEHLCVSQNSLIFKSMTFDLGCYEHIYVIGAGKAGYKMAKAVYDLLGSKITEGCVCIPENSGITDEFLGNIRFLETSHPEPSNDSVLGARAISKIAYKAKANDLIVFLLSGGASSLMCLPVEAVSFNDKKLVNRLLLKSGADISEVNQVRKQLSAIKGGKLAKLAYPATVIQLVLSDVVGNLLETIGSGPMVEDRSTIKEAVDIIRKYKLWDSIPEGIANFLSVEGLSFPETFSMDFERVYTSIIADNRVAITAAAKYLEDFDLKIYFYPKIIQEEAYTAAKNFNLFISDLMEKELGAFAVIAGGEPVVTLDSPSIYDNKNYIEAKKKPIKVDITQISEMIRRKQLAKKTSGGRAQEFALSFLESLSDSPKNRQIFLLTAGTDGIDGPTDAAGALVTHRSLDFIKNNSVELKNYLSRHDSYNFFNRVGGLIKTGYTGTNVNDIYIALVASKIS